MFRTACKSVLANARRAFKDSSGSVGIILGLSMVPLVAAMAVAVDYSRASSVKARLQAAADAAVLAAASDLTAQTAQQRDAIAQRVFRANVDMSGGLTNARIVVTEPGGGIRGNAYADMPAEYGRLLGRPTMPVAALSEAMVNRDIAEIALVLDNTGSMRQDMASLRAAATDLVNQVMAGGGTNVRVSVVPYAASVNPGRAALGMSMMDTGAESRHHARFFENKPIGRIDGNCLFPWERNQGGGGGGGGGGPTRPPDTGPSGNDRSDFFDPMRSFAGVVNELFGIKGASAQAEVTPNTRLPLTGTDVTSWNALLPTGFNFWNDCGLYNPGRISHFDLFARIPGAQWKGCVEARPEPFDVQDTVPSRSTPDTLFVPYFWPDQANPGNDGVGQGRGPFSNNYMSDGTVPRGWRWAGGWEREWSILKYNGVNTATIDEVGPETLGPNASCPDEILPLTSDRQRVLTKIAGLTHWNGSGTITSEGLAWGWRALSPEPPFTEGRPYSRDVRKIIVLMTDGKNQLVEDDNPGSAHKSDYTAYGYLRDGRFPSERWDDSSAFLDERMRLVCENIESAGIEVYTIIFRERDTTIRNLVRGCATRTQNFYVADNGSQLQQAFRQIAGEISKLRLTR
jgi:Flp pilus assembly protein TadG